MTSTEIYGVGIGGLWAGTSVHIYIYNITHVYSRVSYRNAFQKTIITLFTSIGKMSRRNMQILLRNFVLNVRF